MPEGIGRNIGTNKHPVNTFLGKKRSYFKVFIIRYTKGGFALCKYKSALGQFVTIKQLWRSPEFPRSDG